MGNSMNPSGNVSLDHFQKTFPSLAYFINDECTFQEIYDLVQQTCEFLESRNMDCKDRVYTKRVKEMQIRVRDIIKKRSGIIVKKTTDIDMICDYFSYACIYGEDVAPDAEKPEKVYMYDWGKLVKDIPERTLKSHLQIQGQLEQERPRLVQDYLEISEQRAQQQGWDNLAQQEYFSNIDKYEDLSFSTNNLNTLTKQQKDRERAVRMDRDGIEILKKAPQQLRNPEEPITEETGKKVNATPLAQTIINTSEHKLCELSDDDQEAEEGGNSPALLGGFILDREHGDLSQ